MCTRTRTGPSKALGAGVWEEEEEAAGDRPAVGGVQQQSVSGVEARGLTEQLPLFCRLAAKPKQRGERKAEDVTHM